MWLTVFCAFGADPQPGADPDPGWVDSTVAAWTSLPAESRIDALRAMVTSAGDDDTRKSALIALGRLEQTWPVDAPAEAHATYARELLLAADAGRRSYVVAAAGLGARLGADGLPTMSVEEARALYAERRFAPGVVEWNACAPPSGVLGAFERAGGGGYWVVGETGRWRERRRPTVDIRPTGRAGVQPCGQGEVDAGAGLGWTLFEGTRPVVAARELPGGPSDCVPLRIRVVGATFTDASGATRGGGEVVDVEMPPRVQDCGTLAQWEEVAGALNARIASDLRLGAADVAGLGASPSTLEGFRACAEKRPADGIDELCAID